MIQIINPSTYKTTPWKNGQGETVELAISKNGCLNHFDWRISIATVSEDGAFSNFSGLRRDLFLLEGNGIRLIHNETKTDVLESLYAVSTFDGGEKTVGVLSKGTIKDFNLMTKQGKFLVNAERYIEPTEIQLPEQGLCFIYSHLNDLLLTNSANTTVIPQGYLLTAEQGMKGYQLKGENMLIIQLIPYE